MSESEGEPMDFPAASIVRLGDPSLVLVVSRVPVNRVVVTRIAERCGMRTIAADPSEAADVLSRRYPATLILDAGADNGDCDCMIDDLAFRRAGIGATSPAVVVLSNTTALPHDAPIGRIADEVVAKPITPEALQPTILRLSRQVRAAV